MSAEDDTENENESESEEEEEEEEELEEANNTELKPPPPTDPQQSTETQATATTDIHTDEEYYSGDSMVQNEEDEYDEEIGPLGSHKRQGSIQEKRESIHRQKAAMEEKLRTLSQKLDQGLDSALDEFAEMEQINEDKTIFGDLFDKIDPDDNGDVDEKEWIAGLKRLNVGIEESDMAKLFKLMDGDKSGYIDRQDWITFCMTSYNSKELQRLHDSVLSNIKGHSRKPSNMFHAQDVNDWSATAINNLEKQMTQAFLQQGQVQVAQQEEEEVYFMEMEEQAANNPEWAKPERALEWSPKEVAFWLDSIELNQYARKFDEEQVDGSILLNDCDNNLLRHEMGIKPLHVGKILREVDKLRQINKEELQDSYKDWNELWEENRQLIEKIQDQDKQMKELETENAELRLKSMSAVNVKEIAVPIVDDSREQTTTTDDIQTTQGLDLEIGDDATGGMGNEYKTDKDPYVEIKLLQSEIEHLHKQKIIFAENTATEIVKLNRIIKALSIEYTTLSTPYYKKFNPVDSIIRSLGYTPTPNTK